MRDGGMNFGDVGRPTVPFRPGPTEQGHPYAGRKNGHRHDLSQTPTVPLVNGVLQHASPYQNRGRSANNESGFWVPSRLAGKVAIAFGTIGGALETYATLWNHFQSIGLILAGLVPLGVAAIFGGIQAYVNLAEEHQKAHEDILDLRQDAMRTAGLYRRERSAHEATRESYASYAARVGQNHRRRQEGAARAKKAVNKERARNGYPPLP